MNLDFTKPILTLEGTPIPLEPKGEYVTFAYWAKHVLMTDRPEDLPAEKIPRFDLLVKISLAKGALDIGVNEIKLLRDRVLMSASSYVAGRFEEFLNGREPATQPIAPQAAPQMVVHPTQPPSPTPDPTPDPPG